MAGITLAQAQTNLDAWLAASAAVATNQSYRIVTPGGVDRQLTRANAAEIRQMIEFWEAKVQSLSRTRGRTRYVVPQ